MLVITTCMSYYNKWNEVVINNQELFTDVLMVHILLLVYFLFRQEFLSLGYKSTRKLYIHANNLYSACYTTYRWLSVAYRLFFIVMQSKCLVIHSLVYAKRSVIPYAIE